MVGGLSRLLLPVMNGVKLAEFLDVHVYHEPDEPPEVWFTDDHGNHVTIPEITDAEAENGYGFEWIFRVQHNTIGAL